MGGISQPNSAWKLNHAWSFAIDGAIANIDASVLGANEIFINFVDLVVAVTGRRAVRLSVDNGVSFLSGAADYQSVSSAGVGTNASLITLHDTNATTARNGCLFIPTANFDSLGKVLNCPTRGFTFLFRGSSLPITNVRIFNETGGNLTGGIVRIFTR